MVSHLGRVFTKDCGTLLRLVHAQAQSVSGIPSIKRLSTFKNGITAVGLEYDLMNFPCFNVFENGRLVGKARLQINGFGKMDTLHSSEEFIHALDALCSPCLCRAGHLYVCIMRDQPLRCICDSSTLLCIKKSFDLCGVCPLTESCDDFVASRDGVIQYALCLATQKQLLNRVYDLQ